MLLSLLGSALSMLAYFLLSRLAGGGGGAEGGASGSSSSNVFVRAAAAVRSALHWTGARIKAWIRAGDRERVSGCGSVSTSPFLLLVGSYASGSMSRGLVPAFPHKRSGGRCHISTAPAHSPQDDDFSRGQSLPFLPTIMEGDEGGGSTTAFGSSVGDLAGLLSEGDVSFKSLSPTGGALRGGHRGDPFSLPLSVAAASSSSPQLAPLPPPVALSWENVTCRVHLPRGATRYILQVSEI